MKYLDRHLVSAIIGSVTLTLISTIISNYINIENLFMSGVVIGYIVIIIIQIIVPDKKCPKCNRKNRLEALYCSECGIKFIKEGN